MSDMTPDSPLADAIIKWVLGVWVALTSVVITAYARWSWGLPGRIKSLESQVEQLKADTKTLPERQQAVETTLSGLTDEVKSVKADFHSAESKIGTRIDKLMSDLMGMMGKGS